MLLFWPGAQSKERVGRLGKAPARKLDLGSDRGIKEGVVGDVIAEFSSSASINHFHCVRVLGIEVDDIDYWLDE